MSTNIVKVRTPSKLQAVVTKYAKIKERLAKAALLEKKINEKLTKAAINDLRRVIKRAGIIPTSIQYEGSGSETVTVSFSDSDVKCRSRQAMKALSKVLGASFVKKNFVKRKTLRLRKGLSQADIRNLQKALGDDFDKYFDLEYEYVSKKPLTKEVFVKAGVDSLHLRGASIPKPKVRVKGA